MVQSKLPALTHRHLKTSVHILAQDVCQVPLSIRSNLTGGFFFKQSNAKRVQLLREEYLSFLSLDEYKKAECYIWKKKGDTLYIKFGATAAAFSDCSEMRAPARPNVSSCMSPSASSSMRQQ